MRVYLDNCCYNRPFDNQAQVKVFLETVAKLSIQQKMRTGEVEYVWSSVLDFEIRKNKFVDRASRILPWANCAAANVAVDYGIRCRAKEFESAGCDWFFTTDNGILKKGKALTGMRIANPLEFFGGD